MGGPGPPLLTTRVGVLTFTFVCSTVTAFQLAASDFFLLPRVQDRKSYMLAKNFKFKISKFIRDDTTFVILILSAPYILLSIHSYKS